VREQFDLELTLLVVALASELSALLLQHPESVLELPLLLLDLGAQVEQDRLLLLHLFFLAIDLSEHLFLLL
jgi:hypothetical protein